MEKKRVEEIIDHLNNDGESFTEKVVALSNTELLELIDSWATDYNNGDYSFIQYLLIACRENKKPARKKQ